MADKNFKVKTSITSPTPIAITEGGTGQTSANNALNALLPVQTSAANKVLSSDGTSTSWIAQSVAYTRGGVSSRPGSPTAGDLYFNTDKKAFEVWTGSAWVSVAVNGAVPLAPTIGTVTLSSLTASVPFTGPIDFGDAAISTYTATSNPGSISASSASSPISITGLTASTAYTFTVTATNSYGISNASSASNSVTTASVPGAPTSVTISDPGTDGYDNVSLTPGRDSLNSAFDFSQVPDFGAWNTNIKFIDRVPENIEVSTPVKDKGRVAISVTCTLKGVKKASGLFWLDSGIKSFGIEWEIDKEHVREAEEIFVAFPADLAKANFRGDINAVPFVPDQDQLPGTVRDWFPVRDWVDVSDDKFGMTLAPIDAPLIQLGGITTAKAAAKLNPEGPVIMSWALNNHWMVNFKASQGGVIPLRYQLTTHSGAVDDALASKYAGEIHHPAIIMRDYERRGKTMSQSFLALKKSDGVNISSKEAIDGNGIILRVHSVIRKDQKVVINIANFGYARAALVSALEEDTDNIFPITNGEISFDLRPSQYLSIRLTR